MARPAKAVDMKTGTITKEEAALRREAEKKLQGRSDKLKPPTYLTREQKKVFKFILNELKERDILGNLDVYILTQTAITVERMQSIEKMINENQDLLLDNRFMSTKDKYTKDFFRCCNELSLSPQARAKISISAVQAAEKKKNPLLQLLEDDEDDGSDLD